MPWRTLFVTLALLFGCQGAPGDGTVVIGSKNFTEQVILGELLAQQIEAHTDLPVVRKLNLGGTFICHKALVAGDITAYVEYTGTALTAILEEPPTYDPDTVFQTVQVAYRERFGAEWLPPLGFTNTFAIIVRREAAATYGLRSVSDLARVAPQWRAAFGYEFLERADGYPGLAETYLLKFAEPPKVMDLALTYQALADGQVDVIAGDSTNGLIQRLDLMILDDDKRYFPPYDAAPVVSAAALARHPKLREALGALAGVLSNKTMQQLNYLVDGEKRSVQEVVRAFRAEYAL
ncbi:MAG: glycine betaine ABC transporter substrate-binding protein [Nitrospirales bacterium]